MGEPAAQPIDPILVEPLSPAVGLRVSGLDLQRIDAGAADMLQDLWQLGAALLFRAQRFPEEAAADLCRALSLGEWNETRLECAMPLQWQMIGGETDSPPCALVIGASRPLPPLWLAGMEAVADTIRLTDPEFLGQLAGAQAAHRPGAAQHPLVFRHALSRELCVYPPPDARSDEPLIARLVKDAGHARYCYRHEWQPGDVVAFDTRAVRCRWEAAADAPYQAILVPGNTPLDPVEPWPPGEMR